MKKFKILGYSNPITFNCVPVITIIEKDDKVNAIFPDCTIKQLNLKDKSGLEKLENYTEEVKNKFICENEFSYINFDGTIETNNPKMILETMQLDLIKLDTNSTHRAMLEELIISETIKLKSNKELDIDNLYKINKNFEYLRFFTTTRIKSNGQQAKRIFLQHKKNTSFKTDYKKNLYSNDNLTEQDKKLFEKTLIGSIKNISDRYKNNLWELVQSNAA